MKESDFVQRLKNLCHRFLKLSPEKQAELLNSLETIKQFTESRDVLDLFNEIEKIFKSEVEK
ncbi:MAG TPA: hypothetical protein VF571_15425 [Pyrinomonadaceae bacterium]|jgi:hypothetical protein